MYGQVTECDILGVVKGDHSRCGNGGLVADGHAVAVLGFGGEGQVVAVHEGGVKPQYRIDYICAVLKFYGDVASRTAGVDAIHRLLQCLVLAVRADGEGAG